MELPALAIYIQHDFGHVKSRRQKRPSHHCDDVSSIDDEGREEVKRRWVPFLEMLPEYKSICEDILAGNKDKYSE